MNRNWEHCEEKPEKSGIDVIRKGERMLESVEGIMLSST